MEFPKFATDRRAVSPVVGVTLLIGIAVILAAVIGGVVLGIGLGPSDAPQASLEAELVDTSGNGQIDFAHSGGDAVEVANVEIRGGGSASADLSFSPTPSQLQAGGTYTINNSGTNTIDEDVSLVWVGPDGGEEVVLVTFEV